MVMVFQQYLSYIVSVSVIGYIVSVSVIGYIVSVSVIGYIVSVSVIGGGKQSTQRKPPICRVSLTNIIAYCCMEYTLLWD